jgi:hypothetical protein
LTLPAICRKCFWPDPVGYSLSLNLRRRQLDASQKAMAAAKARALYDRQAKERMQSGKGSDGSGGRGHKKNPPENLPDGSSGDARDQAGKALGVSGKLVDMATVVNFP